jgi:transcriptional regulator with XRE-family HTH domain
MILPTTAAKAQHALAQHTRQRRLQLNLTQKGLAARSGVPLPTLRKFEQKGAISLESFLKIQMVLGTLDALVEVTMPTEPSFLSIDDVLSEENPPTRKRGTRT